jgi:PAS domain S-box-containing protein
MKQSSGFSYESQIKLSLLFLILFLVLLNFGTLYLLGKAKTNLVKEHRAKLKGVSTAAGILWQRGEQKALQEGLAELAVAFNLERILITDKNQKILACSGPVASLEIESTSYPVYEFPIFDPESEKELFVRIETRGHYLGVLDKISRLDAIFRGVGILLAVFLTFVLINAILRPYRLMRKKAEGARMKPTRDDEDTDFVVNVFSSTIEELRKKEKLLEELYKGSERKAEKLSYFNQYILKSISNGVIICDVEGKIVSFNPAAQRILGYLTAEVKGRKYTETFEGNDLVFKLLDGILKDEKIHSGMEAEFRRKDGQKVWLGISSSFIKDESGAKLGAVLFFTDMTDLKKLQKEMATTEKMASLGQMSAGLAHELRNSMSTIWGFGKLLKKSLESNHPMMEAVEMIVNESHATEEMLQRFLTFAKPMELAPGEVMLKDVIQESLGAIKGTLKAIKVKLEAKEEIPWISGDPLLLKQCFQNLFQNSIDAMPRGGELFINIEKSIGSKAEKDFLTVQISDTGEGISQDELERVFLPFHSSKEKGVGLGLSLVRKIIDLHQGRIEIQSKPQMGTTFKIYLPLVSHKVAAGVN